MQESYLEDIKNKAKQLYFSPQFQLLQELTTLYLQNLIMLTFTSTPDDAKLREQLYFKYKGVEEFISWLKVLSEENTKKD